jgi:hypothetical protein
VYRRCRRQVAQGVQSNDPIPIGRRISVALGTLVTFNVGFRDDGAVRHPVINSAETGKDLTDCAGPFVTKAYTLANVELKLHGLADGGESRGGSRQADAATRSPIVPLVHGRGTGQEYSDSNVGSQIRLRLGNLGEPVERQHARRIENKSNGL